MTFAASLAQINRSFGGDGSQPRRYRGSGRFRPAAPMQSVPLLEAAVKAKSAPHVRGAATKRARQRAKVLAVMAALRAECGLV